MPARRIATIVTTVTLALPATALAQSAGDEEYQNPLTGSEPAESAPAQEPAAAPAPAQASEPAAEASEAPAAAAPAGELPRTGLPAGLVAATGAALLAGGAGLRRRL